MTTKAAISGVRRHTRTSEKLNDAGCWVGHLCGFEKTTPNLKALEIPAILARQYDTNKFGTLSLLFDVFLFSNLP